jgi:hypothetical protein
MIGAALAVSAGSILPAIAAGDSLVNTGSADPATLFAQNKQNEPAMAIDANHPNIVVAGSNDEIDLETCNAGDPTRCPFTPGVGVSGVYFSFDNGSSWTQPTYQGWSARQCVVAPNTPCSATVGPIGTLPKYYEHGLVADGDPALAFGPVPGANGSFSWGNGSRLYYANLTSNFNTARGDGTFPGFEAIAVSRTDNVQAAAAGDASVWMDPVIASNQSSTTFSDKEQIWADNASSSPFFGHVYICNPAFRSLGRRGAPAPLMMATSTDGGSSWNQQQVSAAVNNSQHPGRSGCTVRTDSSGVVYVFVQEFGPGTPGTGSHVLIQSFDGGKTWTKGRSIFSVTDTCVFFDPVVLRCVMDGVAGARDDLSASPSVDIANNAPTGANASNRIVDAWADGRNGINHEHVMVSTSNDGGNTWSNPASVETGADRGYYAAAAISPNGSKVYVVYNAFDTPFQPTTATPRILVGVVKQADVSGNDPATWNWSELHRGDPGDPRNSSQNNLVGEFLGDYVYAAATNAYGAGVWNDTRNTTDCPAIDAWRQSNETGGSVPRPSPNVDCAANWGNSDIYSFTSSAGTAAPRHR